MPVIPNLSETDRLKRVQARVVYADYIVQQQALEQKIKNNTYGGPSGSYNALDVTNRVQDNVYLTQIDVSTIRAASYYGVPSVPTNVVATGGTSQASLTWDTPFSGYVPVLSYTIVSEPATTTQTSSVPSVTFTGLTNGISYTFSVSATNKYGTSQLSQASAAVVPLGTPTVTTTSLTAVTTTKTLIGSVTTNGGSLITEMGVVWSPTVTSPTIANTKEIFTPIVQSGSFTKVFTGATTVYARAYATNAAGTSYGAVFGPT